MCTGNSCSYLARIKSFKKDSFFCLVHLGNRTKDLNEYVSQMSHGLSFGHQICEGPFLVPLVAQ